jgi:hypothetical protein
MKDATLQMQQQVQDIKSALWDAVNTLRGSAVDRPDYLAFEDERYEALDCLSSTPAHTGRGITAKVSVLKMQEVLEDPTGVVALAESLADDVLRL